MSRVFTEPEWRAIARVEHLSLSRYPHDGFHGWCERRRLVGPTFALGEFYLGTQRDEARVYEATSALDFAVGEDKAEVLDEARQRIFLIGSYLPDLLARWAVKNAAEVLETAERRARSDEYEAAARAKEHRRLTRKLPKRTVAVYEASGGLCHYCAVALDLRGKWHIEHKMPRALKGGSEMHNLVAACVPCNMRKRDRTDLEFQALLATESAIAQAAQSGVVGADPSVSEVLSLHDLQHAQPSYSTPLI